MKIEPFDPNEELTAERAIRSAKIHLRSRGKCDSYDFKGSQVAHMPGYGFEVRLHMRHFSTGAKATRVLLVQESDYPGPGLYTKVTDMADQTRKS